MSESPEPESHEHDGRQVSSQDSAWVMQSLEAGQLASALAAHYPRRKLKRSQTILFWGLRIYLLFMMGVVCYQIWTAVR